MFLFAGIKAGWDKRKEQKMPVSFVFVFTGRQAGIKRKEQKMPVSFVFVFTGRQAGIKRKQKNAC